MGVKDRERESEVERGEIGDKKVIVLNRSENPGIAGGSNFQATAKKLPRW